MAAATTTVTLTISTCGPNLPTLCTTGPSGDGRQYGGIRFHILPWFTLAWAAMVGIVMVGRKSRREPCLNRGITAVCLGLGLTAVISCGGVTGVSITVPPPVTLNPGLATLFADEVGNSWPAGITQQQFTANQSVTWAVTGGNANGTIDGTGLYTAPAEVPNPVIVTVTATSPTAAASAFVTVATPTALGASQIMVTATAVGGTAQGDAVTLVVK